MNDICPNCGTKMYCQCKEDLKTEVCKCGNCGFNSEYQHD